MLAVAAFLHQFKQRGVHFRDVPFLVIEARHLAFIGRRDLHQRLVGHDFGHRLVFFDDVAFADQPLDQFALHDTFADIGQYKITHDCSPVLIST